VLVLGDFALGFVAPHLLIQGIQKLLAGGGSGERGAVIERASEAAKIEQSFRRAIERDAHAIEQVDNSGSGVAHRFYRRLVSQEITAVHRVIEVLPG